MSSQLRALLVLVGAVLVAVTYTFPLWQPFLGLIPGRGETAVLGLPADMSEQLAMLPPERLDALLDLADEDVDLAQNLAMAHLRQDRFINDDVPAAIGQNRVIGGLFQPASETIDAEGDLTIYETADGSHIVRFDNLDVTHTPEMRVYLSAAFNPLTQEEMEQNGSFHNVSELRGNAGNQNYTLAPEIDLSGYNSIVIYSEALGVVIAYARFSLRL